MSSAQSTASSSQPFQHSEPSPLHSHDPTPTGSPKGKRKSEDSSITALEVGSPALALDYQETFQAGNGYEMSSSPSNVPNLLLDERDAGSKNDGGGMESANPLTEDKETNSGSSKPEMSSGKSLEGNESDDRPGGRPTGAGSEEVSTSNDIEADIKAASPSSAKKMDQDGKAESEHISENNASTHPYSGDKQTSSENPEEGRDDVDTLHNNIASSQVPDGSPGQEAKIESGTPAEVEEKQKSTPQLSLASIDPLSPPPSSPPPPFASSSSSTTFPGDTSISATVFHSSGPSNGVLYRSIGVSCSLLTDAATSTSPKPREKPQLWNRLPTETAERILKLVAGFQERESRERKADPRRTGWYGEGLGTLGTSKEVLAPKHYYLAMKRCMLVSRSWYWTLLPELWRTAFVPVSSNANSRTFITLLSKRTTIKTPEITRAKSSPAPKGKGKMGPSVRGTMVENTLPPPGSNAKPQSSSSSMTVTPQPVPLNSVKNQPSSQHPATIPTYGSLIRTLILPESEYAFSHLSSILKQCPQLETLCLSRYGPANSSSISGVSSGSNSSSNLKSFPYYLNSSLTSLLEFAISPHSSHNDSRVETLIDVFNRAPNISKFSCGGISLNSAQANRLAFVWKINSRLVHAGTGAKGNGLQEIYFGNGSNIGLPFIKGLKDCCSNLERLHIDAGVALTADSSSSNGSSSLDLKDFSQAWGSKLKSLTLVGNSDISTRNSLDDVLNLCPNLQTLHLRSDFITFDFFRSILTLNAAPVNPLAYDSSDGPSSVILPSRLRLDHLRITHTVPSAGRSPTPKDLLVFASVDKILLFARTCLEVEARGITWPAGWDDGGRTSQRDLLLRCMWLMEGVERKKKEMQAAASARGINAKRVGFQNNKDDVGAEGEEASGDDEDGEGANAQEIAEENSSDEE